MDRGDPAGSVIGGRRPHVVIQNDTLNGSAIATVLVCPLTTNLRRARFPGNVLLVAGEGGLPAASVVNVSQVGPVDREQLQQRIGAISRERVREIIAGINTILTPRG